MAELVNERVVAEAPGDVTVFLIGMRINRIWKVWKWLPVLRAMPRMLEELSKRPELGLLSYRTQIGLRNLAVLQYWQSAEHLRAYAHAADRTHLPAWQEFNAKIGTSGDVGIWHETYVVPRGSYESIYVNMPRYGLGVAGELFPAKGARATAAKRLSGVAPGP